MRTIHIWRAIVLVIAAAAMSGVLMSTHFVMTLVALVVLVLAAVSWTIAERRVLLVKVDELQQDKDSELMRALSHYRHDWMNDLQVLFGYISLKKYDKLAPYLEKIKSKLSEESHISNIGNVSLSLLLLSYRQYSQNFELIVTLDPTLKFNMLPIRQDRLAYSVKEGLQLFQQAALPSSSEEQNTLECSFVTSSEHIQLIYQYTGLIDPTIEEALTQWKQRLQDRDGSRLEHVMEDGQVDVIVHLSYE